MALMRDKVLRLTDEGCLYRRPDGSTYLRPYAGSETESSDEAAPMPNHATDDDQQGTPICWHPDHARETPAIKLRILAWLRDRGPARITRLAKGARISHQSAYRHCRDMLMHQLIDRYRVAGGDGCDNKRYRHYELSITPRGERMLADWHEYRAAGRPRRLKSETA